MEPRGGLLLAAVFSLLCRQGDGYLYRIQRKFSEDMDWSYAGTLNQNNWAKKFPSCSNAKQSPINIEQNLAQVQRHYQQLSFEGWEEPTSTRTTIKNDGKTVAVNVGGDFYVSGGALRSKVKVGRITFHWGRCNASTDGSEHSLDGVRYPLEMQIYCYQPQRFHSLDESIKAGGRIMALAVLFETSSEENSNYGAIVDSVRAVSRYGKSAQVLPFTLRGLLPNSTEKYFTYNGSLTTPPCSETVEWVVFRNPAAISEEQLETFCEVMTMQQAGYVMLMDYLQNNFREQQHFMGQVFSSYTGREEVLTPVCSSEPENIQAAAHNRSSLLVTWERPRAVYDAAIDRYSVSYAPASGEQATPTVYLTDGDQDVGAILSELLANSSYAVQVAAVCSNGLHGRLSDPLMVSVPADDPDGTLDPGSDALQAELDRLDLELLWDKPGHTPDPPPGPPTPAESGRDRTGAGPPDRQPGLCCSSAAPPAEASRGGAEDGGSLTTERGGVSSSPALTRSPPTQAGPAPGPAAPPEVQVHTSTQEPVRAASPSMLPVSSTQLSLLVTDVSNSSHESRVGPDVDRGRTAVLPLAVVSALAAVGLLVLVGVLVYWRTCFQTAHFYVEDSWSSRVTGPASPPGDQAAFSASEFLKHVRELHHMQGFHREFQEVQACTVDMELSSGDSEHPDNRSKNSSILAYDHSRVRLLPQAGRDGPAGDYINANFVDGFGVRRAYIAAQAPLRGSSGDFWRMIWEQQVGVVVMITRLVEDGKRKCEQYWPAEAPQVYGGYLVTPRSSRVLAHYTQRTFTLSCIHTKKGRQKGRSPERTLTHFQYTRWPAVGVPDSALPLLSFIRRSSRAGTHAAGPVVVHCSGGAGRTGTYILLDSMLQQLRAQHAVNVGAFLKHVRTQQNHLVQTEEQFVFIHDALAEAIVCGETEVAAEHLHGYVDALLEAGPAGRTRLEEQFKLLCRSAATASERSAALLPRNRSKNRPDALMPAERWRVRLALAEGEASDYINASYVTGYRHSSEFIITQNPLPGTMKDFWRLVWEHSARTVVSLPAAQPGQEEEEVDPRDLWPQEGQRVSCEAFTVSRQSEEQVCLASQDLLQVHTYLLESTKDRSVLEVKRYSAPTWPNPDRPISSTFELVAMVKEQSAAQDGPTVVHDRVGGVTAATFCALTSLTRQLEAEGAVDVFQVAQMTNAARPGAFSQTEDLRFLYEALLSQLGCVPSDTNGSVAVWSGPAPSLESLD